MEVKPIKTGADYRASLQEIETLMAARPDTPEGERLDVLAALVEAYERKHYPLGLPDPVAPGAFPRYTSQQGRDIAP